MTIKVLEAHEVNEHRVALPGWQEQYTQMSAGRFHGRLVHAESAAVELYEERMNLRVEQEFHAPADALVFSFDMSDNALYLLDGQTRNAWVTPENYREVAVVLKQPAAWNRSASEFRQLILQPLRSSGCSSFASSLCGVLAEAVQGQVDVDAPGFARQIADGCFQVLDEALQVGGRGRAECHARRVVERVKEVVNDCPQDSFGVLDLAEAAGVSVRHLQQSFMRYADMPPTVWLRNRRLNAARRDLLAADPAQVTVAEVAMRWSFWHLGRFSQSYHGLFGEYPKATLKRG
ncbi:helix-turn-helix domain-containing protein [Pseudomonas sp. 148P]|uniref:Helix-turn-helix domain-containing protein n=1 Tax=Pseudomonas ulcerans TaxID=3115852 RepID=A0ABU7HUB3_9PSED|nr:MULTISPECIES: helix-turn-helix domain-containing protein [unclassified Pseudomonas]MEE1923947.1 helix-turn-helix domain-containing protein [Pseudomonas sp. 147P]MEE1935124.1 helix-turn-helix domain-containing protein [Pseudomonas sp. 148P]